MDPNGQIETQLDQNRQMDTYFTQMDPAGNGHTNEPPKIDNQMDSYGDPHLHSNGPKWRSK